MSIEDLPNIQGVYKINFPNGKIYIGISNQIKRRILEHARRDVSENPQLPISRAIKEYGISDVEILEENHGTREELCEREKYWIKYYNATDSNIGYNVSLGGDGASEGWLNHQALLTEEQVRKIYELLLNSSYNIKEIAEQFNVTQEVISRINMGYHYVLPGYEYPLRKKRVEKYGVKNKRSRFYQREDLVEALRQELIEGIIPIKDLNQKYQVNQQVTTAINQGKFPYYDSRYTYPLRPRMNLTSKRVFSEESLLEIKKLLEESEVSMTEISNRFSCDRKVISDINKGKRQFQQNWEYPLRKNRMKTGPKKINPNPVSTILESEE